MAGKKEEKKEEKQEAKSQEPKRQALKYKVIAASDYFNEARELFGTDKMWDNAVALLYSENKVIAVLDRKGETKFVVEL